jgi:hypothetical protein
MTDLALLIFLIKFYFTDISMWAFSSLSFDLRFTRQYNILSVLLYVN